MFDELLLTVLLTSVPLILAATGELVVERSGVLKPRGGRHDADGSRGCFWCG